MDFTYNKINKNPYSNSNVVLGEPSIREEIKTILYTEKRGAYYVYRRIRRDADGYPIMASSTLTNRSAEATYGNNKGMKYLFDDYIVVGYLSQGSTYHEPGKVKDYGDSRTDLITLYLEHDVLFKKTNNNTDMPDEFDKIIEPVIDIDGNLISPLKVRVKYDIGACEPYKLDNFGRVEYFKLNLLSNHDDTIKL